MEFICKNCSSRFRLPDEKVPEQAIELKCPNCNAPILVSRSTAVAPPPPPAPPSLVDVLDRIEKSGKLAEALGEEPTKELDEREQSVESAAKDLEELLAGRSDTGSSLSEEDEKAIDAAMMNELGLDDMELDRVDLDGLDDFDDEDDDDEDDHATVMLANVDFAALEKLVAGEEVAPAEPPGIEVPLDVPESIPPSSTAEAPAPPEPAPVEALAAADTPELEPERAEAALEVAPAPSAVEGMEQTAAAQAEPVVESPEVAAVEPERVGPGPEPAARVEMPATEQMETSEDRAPLQDQTGQAEVPAGQEPIQAQSVVEDEPRATETEPSSLPDMSTLPQEQEVSLELSPQESSEVLAAVDEPDLGGLPPMEVEEPGIEVEPGVVGASEVSLVAGGQPPEPGEVVEEGLPLEPGEVLGGGEVAGVEPLPALDEQPMGLDEPALDGQEDDTPDLTELSDQEEVPPVEEVPSQVAPPPPGPPMAMPPEPKASTVPPPPPAPSQAPVAVTAPQPQAQKKRSVMSWLLPLLGLGAIAAIVGVLYQTSHIGGKAKVSRRIQARLVAGEQTAGQKSGAEGSTGRDEASTSGKRHGEAEQAKAKEGDQPEAEAATAEQAEQAEAKEGDQTEAEAATAEQAEQAEAKEGDQTEAEAATAEQAEQAEAKEGDQPEAEAATAEQAEQAEAKEGDQPEADAATAEQAEQAEAKEGDQTEAKEGKAKAAANAGGEKKTYPKEPRLAVYPNGLKAPKKGLEVALSMVVLQAKGLDEVDYQALESGKADLGPLHKAIGRKPPKFLVDTDVPYGVAARVFFSTGKPGKKRKIHLAVKESPDAEGYTAFPVELYESPRQGPPPLKYKVVARAKKVKGGLRKQRKALVKLIKAKQPEILACIEGAVSEPAKGKLKFTVSVDELGVLDEVKPPKKDPFGGKGPVPCISALLSKLDFPEPKVEKPSTFAVHVAYRVKKGKKPKGMKPLPALVLKMAKSGDVTMVLEDKAPVSIPAKGGFIDEKGIIGKLISSYGELPDDFRLLIAPSPEVTMGEVLHLLSVVFSLRDEDGDQLYEGFTFLVPADDPLVLK